MKWNYLSTILLYMAAYCVSLPIDLMAQNNLIPEGTTEIKEDAFLDNKNITSIVIPKSVTKIGSRAFYNCSNLTSVVLPSSLTLIDKNAFFNCTNLSSINLEDTKLSTIQESTFRGCESLSSITLPASVTNIDQLAFSNCKNLSSITFSQNLEKIDKNALWACNLKELIIPDKLKVIEEGAFSSNKQLSKIYIGAGLEKIGWLAFFLCPEITEFQISPNNTHFSVEDGILYSKDKRTLVIYPPKREQALFKLPDATRFIGKDAFKNNYNLVTLDVNQATNFESPEGLFWDCPALEEFRTASNNPAFVALDGVLYNRKKDQLIVYPMGKKETSYSIEEGVLSIFRFAFYHNENLTSVTIPASVKYIQQFIFGGCTALKEVHVKSTTPPDLKWDLGALSEDGGVSDKDYELTVYIPKGTRTAYLSAEGWKLYKYFIETDFETLQPEISEPSDHSLTISWPAFTDASSYTLSIYADATKKELLSSYEFDAQGNLLRSTSFSHVFDNLESGTTYYIETVAYQEKDGRKIVLASNTIEGKTTGEAVANEIVATGQPSCKAYNGQLYIQSPSPANVRVYTPTGDCVWSGTVKEEKTITLNKGLYFIRIGEVSYKIIL